MRAVDPLVAVLADIDPRVRANAATSLGYIGDACAVDALVAALADTDDWTVDCAARALGRIKDARAVDPLITALADRAGNRQAGYRQEVSRYELEPLEEALIAILECSSAGVHHSVLDKVTELGRIRIHVGGCDQDCGMDWESLSSRAVQLARQELISRGLEA